MDRRALEALSSVELQRLFAEARAILAERHGCANFEEIRREPKEEETRPVSPARGSKQGLDAPDEEKAEAEAEAEAPQQPGSGSAAAPPSQQPVPRKRVIIVPSKRSASQQPGAGSAEAPPSRQPVPGKKRVVVIPAKRSCVRGVACDAPDEEEAEAEACQQPGSGSTAAPPPRQSMPGKRLVVIPSKQRSGVRGVVWYPAHKAWRVSWRQGGHCKSKWVFVRRYAERRGGTYEEANAAALRDAVAFREELVRQGLVMRRQSGMNGVSWDPKKKRWRARMYVGGKNKCGGGFYPKDDTPEEFERARLAAMGRRREMEAEHREAGIRRGRIVETKENDAAGVAWLRFEGCWLARIQLLGERRWKRFKPEDLEPEAVETARLLAIRWRRDMEQQNPTEASC